MPTEPTTLVSAGAKLIETLAPALAKSIKSQAQHLKEKMEIKLRIGFRRFIDSNVRRFSTVKTIISSSTPIPLLSIYVNLWLSPAAKQRQKPKRLRDEDFLTQINEYRSVVFTATAGAGKSMLMRYLYLRFLEAQTERLPVFIELRDLNQYPSTTIEDYLLTKIREYFDEFSESQLKYGLETGQIILFLDGFDEIDYDKRREPERQINAMTARFDQLLTFVSSRPADTFASWEKFYVFSVDPFTKKQVELLVSKIPYDDEIKSLFQKKLGEGLFNTHREFLRNPLLTIMMLVTLEQFADVPAKVHLFYEYAFEALFARHDATKGGFQRKRHTRLALDDFKRLLSYFCMYTYLHGLYSFSSEQLLEILQRSLDASQIGTDKMLFKNDLTESTCMLVMDGLNYTFSHRSFQEYFAAYFVCREKVDEFERALPELARRGIYDNVITMVAEMHREKFEETWALPTLELLRSGVKDIDARADYVGFMRGMYGSSPLAGFYSVGPNTFRIGYGRMWQEASDGEKAPNQGYLRNVLYRTYNIFETIGQRIEQEHQQERLRDDEVVRDILNKRILRGDSRLEAINEGLRRGAGIEVRELMSFPLIEDDNEWLRGTWLARYCEMEAEVLRALKDEVAHRVAARRRGLSLFFGDRQGL